MNSRAAPSREATRRSNGFILLLVLVVVAMLSLSTYTFTSLMVTENEASLLAGQQLQARMLVDSGAAHIRYLLELDPSIRQSLGGTYENSQLFQAQLVADLGTARSRARIGIVAPRIDNQGYLGGLRFGLQDESCRLNINALDLDPEAGADLGEAAAAGDDESDLAGAATGASTGASTGGDDDDEGTDDQVVDTSGRAMLMNLPGMTIETADAILDWIDTDDEPREFGAEIDVYSGLTPPYTPQNGPLQTIEELLLVRGVTADMLFGRDINRNGMIDVQEMELPVQVDGDPGDGSMDYGWSAYLTLHSQEKNVTSDGLPRIDLNADDMEKLFDDLSAVMDASWATFIVAYRQNGPYTGNSEDTEPAGNQELDLTRAGRFPLTQVLDLIGAKVRMQVDDGSETVIVESPFSEDPGSMLGYLSKLMDLVSVNPAATIPGRININRAPRLVLLAIPGITTEIVDSLLGQRDLQNSEYDESLQHETWLLSRAVVTLDEMRRLMPYVTAGGDVYRAQIVGYFDQGEIAARAEVIFDGTSALPRIRSWKDISHLGRGYARETLGITSQDDDVSQPSGLN